MSEPRPARPRQVTMAAAAIMAGSVLIVLTGFERVSTLRSLESRRGIEAFLAAPLGSGLGLDVGSATQLLHVGVMVGAGCATAAAILGFHVLRRSRSARVALSALAVPLLLAGMVTDPFFSAVVVVSVGLLWVHPAREWFDGTWRPEPVGGAARKPAVFDVAAPPPTPEAAVPPAGPPLSRAGWLLARPSALLWACVLTWVFASLVLVLMVVSVALVIADPGLVLEQMRRQNPDLAGQGVTEATVASAMYALAALMIAWSAAAMVFAGIAFSGRAWGRTALLVCAGAAAGLLAVLTVAGQVLMLVPLAATGFTFASLMRPEVRQWFAARP